MILKIATVAIVRLKSSFSIEVMREIG